MPSNNRSGADNQQERLQLIYWIVGFVDGEGCFSVSCIKNSTTRFGYQLFPEFVVTQGAKSLAALQVIQNYFQCGRIFINHRHDNHREPLYRFCVRSIDDLVTHIIPFFEQRQLLTTKANDFSIFRDVVHALKAKQHLKERGFKNIVAKIQTMNRQVKRKLTAKSSETKRQHPPKR